MFDHLDQPDPIGTGEVAYEVHGERLLVASTCDPATALLVAREWLRESEQADSGTHTCVVQIRRDGDLVAEHIVALASGPLGRR